VVAYQVGWVNFLAPYAVLAQPIHTAILPEMVTEAREAGHGQVVASLRWALERMAVLVLPVTAGMVALASPALHAVAFGETDSDLLAAAVGGLALGLYSYSAFLLLARGYYALGDSRTPGVVALASAAAGVVVMVLAAAFVDGPARVALLGVGHSVAYTLGAVVLVVGLAGRTGASLRPAGIARIAAVSVAVGIAAWAASRALIGPDPGRLAELAVVAAVAAVGAVVVVAAFKALGVAEALSQRRPADVATVEDLPPEVLA
jgi:putative peptidoglycan lipid II flippase